MRKSLLNNFTSLVKTEFSGYNRALFKKDLLAGITVSAVALPLALAFGVSSGATAASGLITAIIAGIVIGSFSGASFQISGPTGALSAILITISIEYGLQGVFMAGFIAGIILVICGLLKFGKAISIIPMPVIAGFTSGISLIIILGQVDNLFGTYSTGTTAIKKILSYSKNGFDINISTLILGILTIAIMVFWPKKFTKILPGSLAALIIVVILNAILKLDVALVGEIPKSLILPERLELAGFSQIFPLITPAISIAILAMVETLLCGMSASRMSKKPFDGDIELIGQGIGNIIIPFFGGVPATAALARTSVSITAGNQTRLTGIIHSFVLIVAVLLLGGIMSQIPMAALAGILIVTAWKMNEWETIKFLFDSKYKGATADFLITMLVTVTFDLSIAIVAGVSFASIMFVVRSSGLDVTITDVKGNRDALIVYIVGSIFFATVNTLSDSLEEIPANTTLILSLGGVPRVDSSAIQPILDLCTKHKSAGGRVVLCNVQKPVLEFFTRGGVTKLVGKKNITGTDSDAIKLLSSK